MQKDSETLSTSDHMMHSQSAEESAVKAFQCSRCTLVFKSKVYLFEHLNNVHHFGVDKALREAGLKQTGIDEANADNKSSHSASDFLCRHCDFKACQWDIMKYHEKQCPRNTESKKGLGYGTVSQTPETKIPVSSKNHHKDGAGTKDISSYFSVSSTSKTKQTRLPLSSKDLKTYKLPPQTITKYLTGTSGTKPPAISSGSLPDCTKGTLILQESHSNSSGVFKVTAKSMTDILKNVSDQVLSTDGSKKSREELGETVGNSVIKRTNNERAEDPPAKKAKRCKEETKPLMNGKTSKQASSAENSFEISDEDDESVHLVNGSAESPKLYFCKHCDYSDVSIRCVANHYQNHHPYVRFNSDYIEDPRDQSATFRCLECPVEFSAVSEFKRHYSKNHPEAPDVILMQSHEFNLVFRCFVCQFTSNELKALKEHYKEKHPTHKVDNSLSFCRYSRCQIASSRLNACKKTPERSERNSPESTQASCKVTSAASLQNIISKPTDGTVYCCNKCNFSHKSVVVMHVHYQKSHQDERISIEKIKQSCSAPLLMPEKSPNHVTEIQNCTPQKNTSESLSSMSLADTPEASKIPLKSPKLKEVDSAEDRRRARKSLAKHERDVSAEIDRMFYCQFCSYSSINVRSVIGHHNAKHTQNGPTSIEELLFYRTTVQEKKLQSQAKVSGGTPSSDFETGKQNVVHSKKALQFEECDAADAVKEFNAYDCPEKLFYCQKCNFANPSLKGVLNHQIKIHKDIFSNKESVLQHTALICEEIEKSKSPSTELSCAIRLPLPLLNEGDENVLFCHYCNYRHSNMDQVMKHYFNRHRGCGITPEQVRSHTSVIRNKMLELHQKSTEDFKHASLGDKRMKKKSKMLAKGFSNSLSAPVSQTQRILKCHRCSYITQHLYVLRRHIWKVHKSNRSNPEILKMCFRQGSIQSGYHCDLCVFSPKNGEALYEHYQEQHPERKVSLEYVSTRLYVGPDTCFPKNKKCEVKHTESSSPSQTSVENEAKTYSCKACSFKGSSVSDITCHYRTVHPWSVKEDGSDPGVKISKKRCGNSQLKDQNEILASFETYQIPLEFDSSSHEAKESHKTFKCSFCPASFFTQHSLSTHCGMKHRDAQKDKCKRQEKQIQIHTRVHVFKCPHCSYVNSSYQGAFTHCHMKHPALDFKADSLHLDKSCLKTLDDGVEQRGPGGSLKYRGYMCKTCQQIYANMEKLNKHREKCHKSVNIVKPAPKTSPLSKINQSNTYSAQGTLSKTSFLRKKIYAKVQCQHCNYTCTTRIALGRHLHIHHRDSSVSSVKDYTYRCALCSKFYCRKKRLGNHYIKKHGKDAFLKHYVPVYKQVQQKSISPPADPSSELPETTLEQHKSSTMVGERILVYKCPVCPYVNASHHGTLTHCQMKHPDLVARADELQTDEIFVNNMVKCTIGKGSNERGYMCNKCPQIHASLGKLKIHTKRYHDHSKHSGEAEEQPDRGLVDTVLEEDLKNKASAAKSTEINSSSQLDTAETCRSNALSLQTRRPFKCHMCTYEGSCRKYLYCHYKFTHKLDALSRFKLLEKYNKRKSRNSKLIAAHSEESPRIKCKKCVNLTFSSSQLLIAHYTTFHCKMDFTVLAKISKRSTGSYKCRHCKKVIHGIKNLWCHLDRHRARRMKKANAAQAQATLVTTTTPENKSSDQNEMSQLEAMDFVQENETLVETFTLESPSKSPDQEYPEVESRDHKHCCKLCRRTFMSLRGLRSHERSHAALAAIKNVDNLPSSALKQNINKHVLYKAGTLRPFLCTFCSYRTTVLGLWKSHVMKNHQDVLMEAEETRSRDEEGFTKQPPILTAENNNLPEPNEEPEMTQKSLYLEPPDVQRQLNQYSLMAQVGVSSKANLQELTLPDNSQLHCEFCNFNTGHLSSIRRHYLNRHGRKVFRCKDCDFLTGVRKTLEKHMETGHSTFRSEPSHQKEHHCPFCLYQTKNKNNMIDHIVLHREERVVPIEVRRSKLSRYLHGVVFRCHKCTFTSGNAENLRIHMMKHDDVKPYKCRLCYFDCTQLSDLEAHLSDKHQVMRNHELVGHVSLDQLEAACKMPEEEDESSNLEHYNNEDEDVETEEFDVDCNDVLSEKLAKNPSEHDIRVKIVLHNLDNEQDPQEQAGLVPNAASEQMIKNDGCTKDAAVQFEDSRGPEKESQEENQDKARNLKFTQTKQEPAEWSSSEYNQKTAKAQVLQHEASSNKSLQEGDSLHQMPVLDEKGCKRDGTVKKEQISKTDADNRENHFLNKQSNIISCNSKGPVTDSNPAHYIKAQANNVRAPENLKVEKQPLTSTQSCTHPKTSHKGNFGLSVTNCKEEALSLSDGEMPVLENVCLNEEMSPFGFCKEEDETNHAEQKQKREEKMITKDENPHKEQEEGASVKDSQALHAHRGGATVEPVELLCPSVTEKKPYACKFCGRNLMNHEELTRHVMRHGM